ncbi:MAG: hypothetical protein N4A63_02335 [Vallitalea sp.]|nr:hypothetical protein [Vallitalea sp.]
MQKKRRTIFLTLCVVMFSVFFIYVDDMEVYADVPYVVTPDELGTVLNIGNNEGAVGVWEGTGGGPSKFVWRLPYNFGGGHCLAVDESTPPGASHANNDVSFAAMSRTIDVRSISDYIDQGQIEVKFTLLVDMERLQIEE